MSTRARRLASSAAALALLGVVAACSGSDGGDSASYSEPAPAAQADAGGEAAPALPAPEEAQAPEAEAPADLDDAAGADVLGGTTADATRSSGSAADTTTDTPEAQPGPAPGDRRSLVKKGNVAYRADDVRAARFQVLRVVVQKYGGEVAEDSSESDDEGVPLRTLMTLRVPVDDFEEAMEGLDGIKTVDGIEVIDSGSTSVDVSTQVIDTGVRIQLQKRSIERISVLLDRATSIRDIVGIERELARREAELGSLQKRQAFLADQTAYSTIAVSIERPTAATVLTTGRGKLTKEEETGFVAGLGNGWDAFLAVTTALLTALGALLPFGILAALVGVPLRVWWRRRQVVPATASAEASTA